jgi:uncharacterized membrane protein YtjA (UPF0391 family)
LDTFKKIGTFFNGLITGGKSGVNEVEKDVKIVLWVVIVMFVIYLFKGRR